MSKPTPLLLLLMAASPVVFAQDCNVRNTISGDAATIPVLVDSRVKTLADSGKQFNDYAFSLGTNNEFERICVPGTEPTTLVFDLSSNQRHYVFEEIRFGFPDGFDPSDSPFKLSVVDKQTLTVRFVGSEKTLDHSFEYDLILRNVGTGERIIIDPQVRSSGSTN